MINLNDFKKYKDWTKIYDGRWSFLTTTHFVEQYTREIKFGKLYFKTKSIVFVSQGRSNGWMRQSDRDALGRFLASQIVKKPANAGKIAKQLKSQTINFLKLIAKNESSNATQKLYNEFWRRLLTYYKPHINVKYVVDYLSPEQLKKHLAVLQSARLAAEPVLNRTEDFMIGFAKILGKQTGYSYKLLLCLTKYELETYFKTKRLPNKTILRNRNIKSAILADKQSVLILTGNKIHIAEKIIHQTTRINKINGFTAFPGKITGTVKIITDPAKSGNFKHGDILVTGATRPEFLPIMHKAGAFVTDAGGILSHAAITAREMRKPCIIGTKIATKIFKDGDLVEVDANKGIVKIIKKA